MARMNANNLRSLMKSLRMSAGNNYKPVPGTGPVPGMGWRDPFAESRSNFPRLTQAPPVPGIPLTQAPPIPAFPLIQTPPVVPPREWTPTLTPTPTSLPMFTPSPWKASSSINTDMGGQGWSPIS